MSDAERSRADRAIATARAISFPRGVRLVRRDAYDMNSGPLERPILVCAGACRVWATHALNLSTGPARYICEQCGAPRKWG